MRTAALVVALLVVGLYVSRQAVTDDRVLIADENLGTAIAADHPVLSDEVSELRERYLELVEQQITTWSKKQLEENIKKVEGVLVDQKAAEMLRSAEDILGQVNKAYPQTSSGRIAKALLEMLEQSRPGRRFGIGHGTVYPQYPATSTPAIPRVPQTESREAHVPFLEQAVPNQ